MLQPFPVPPSVTNRESVTNGEFFAKQVVKKQCGGFGHSFLASLAPRCRAGSISTSRAFF